MSLFKLHLIRQHSAHLPAPLVKPPALAPHHWMQNGQIEQWFGQDAKTGQIFIHQAKRTADSLQALPDATHKIAENMLAHADKFKWAVNTRQIDLDKAHFSQSLLDKVMARADAKLALWDHTQTVHQAEQVLKTTGTLTKPVTTSLTTSVTPDVANTVAEHGLTWLSHHLHDPLMFVSGVGTAAVAGLTAWMALKKEPFKEQQKTF